MAKKQVLMKEDGTMVETLLPPEEATEAAPLEPEIVDPWEGKREPLNPKYTKGFREEIPDPTPVAVPVGYGTPLSMEDIITGMFQRQALERLRDGEMETPEEADDFDVGDSELVLSDLQVVTMAEDHIAESKILDRKKEDDNGGKNTDVGKPGSPAPQPSGEPGTGGEAPGAGSKALPSNNPAPGGK